MAQAVDALQAGAELDLVTIDLQAAYGVKRNRRRSQPEDLLDAVLEVLLRKVRNTP